jgi:uncharacterized membrane protein YfcA
MFAPLIVVFLAVIMTSLTGFGSGLISMAILPGLIGIQTAVPLVALMSATLEFFLLVRYREAFRLENVWRMGLAAIISIPIGVWVLRSLEERILLPILGVIIVGYSLYALFNFRLPNLEHPGWGVLAGFLGGLLGGAYSIAGPPVIIYANCRNWKPDEFRANLLWIFLIIDIFAVINHWVAGNMTRTVFMNFLWTVPAIILGLLAGPYGARYLDPKRFRSLVLFLLLIMGIRWIISAL